MAAPEQLSLLVYIWPTRLGVERQALMGSWQDASAGGYGLEIDASGKLSFRVGNGSDQSVVSLPAPLLERRWQLVGVSFDSKTGHGTLFSQPQADTTTRRESLRMC